MTRELTAHHEPAVLSSPHVGGALAVHRATPGLSLVELLERAGRSGAARRAVEHGRDCATCGVGRLCETGARLARKIPSRRRPTR
jgi:hypothetical protein